MSTVTSTASQSGVQPRSIHAGAIHVVAHYVLSGETADTIQMVKVPDNAVIHDIVFYLPATSQAGSGKINYCVGDGDSVNRFISTATASDTAVIARIDTAGGVGYTYSFSDNASPKADTIDVTFLSGTTATTSQTICLSVIYSVDNV